MNISGDGFEAQLAQAIFGVRKQKPPKTSLGFGNAKFRQLYKAVAFANLQGCVLNTFLTVSWSTVGITTDGGVEAAHKHLLTRLREWCGRRKQPIPYALVWVKERSERLGVHSHLLLHIPQLHRARFGSMVKAFVEQHSGKPVLADERGPDGKKLSTIFVAAPTSKYEPTDKQIWFQWRVFRYLMKGATKDQWAEVVQPEHAHILFNSFAKLPVRSQGAVTGKRTGYSSKTLGLPAWKAFAGVHDLGEDWIDERIKLYGPEYGDSFLAQRAVLGLKI